MCALCMFLCSIKRFRNHFYFYSILRVERNKINLLKYVFTDVVSLYHIFSKMNNVNKLFKTVITYR